MSTAPTIPDDVAAVVSPALARYGGMVGVFDADDRLRWANGVYRMALGIPEGLGLTWAELMRWSREHRVGAVIDAPDFEAWLASAASRRGQQPYRQFEVDLHDGRWMLLSQTVDARGWILELGADVSDLGRDSRDLRIARDQALRASQVDPLTGIGNRAFVLQRLNEMLAEPGGPMPCVALIDLDHFKRVNDWLGHAAGDEVLRQFAHNLQTGLRRADACGRIGGEEFLLVVGGGIDPAQAEQIVSRVLARVRASRPLPNRPGFSYSASAGLTRARPGERAEEVMARADAALYRAKDAGRDRCVRAD